MIRPPPRSTLFPTRRSSDLIGLASLEEIVVSIRMDAAKEHFNKGFPTLTAVFENRPHVVRSEEHTSELQSRRDLVCRLLLEKKKRPATKHNHLFSLAIPSEH